MSFEDELRQIACKVDARANAVVKKIVIDIGTSLVLKTPVGDPSYWKSPPPPGYVGGRARGNWQYALNAPDITNHSPIDKTGSATIGRIVGKVPDEATGLVHYITNSVPYIVPLEYHSHSRQAPNGMVGITIVEFDAIVKAANAALGNQ